MPDALLRHQPHQLDDGVVWFAGVSLARHDRRHRPVEYLGTTGESAYDVTLGDDALDRGAIPADDDGADIVLSQYAQQLADRGLGRDRHDAGALAPENVADPHHRPPFLRRC